jgi:8-oxo-dGTP pyrophosphatase MutT (NUDIX family)
MDNDFEARLRRAIGEYDRQYLTIEGARAAAVLIPVIAGPNPTLVFTVRTDTLPSHKGQISFPGGSVDPGDATPAQTALRETQEELGLEPGEVDVLGELDTFPTFVSGYVVTPVVGWLSRSPKLTPNPAEVAEVLHVPISELSEEIRAEPGFAHAGQTYPTEAWIWNDYVIWGVTARIVRGFLQVLGDAGLIDPPGETASWTGWSLPATGGQR